MSTYTIDEIDGGIVVRGTGQPLDLWNALRRYYLTIRPVRRGPGGLRYPETRNRDVRALVAIFARELGRTSPDVASYEREAKAWANASRRALGLMRGHGEDETFTDNERFWVRDTKQLAVYLSVARYLPTRTELLDDFAALTGPARRAV